MIEIRCSIYAARVKTASYYLKTVVYGAVCPAILTDLDNEIYLQGRQSSSESFLSKKQNIDLSTQVEWYGPSYDRNSGCRNTDRHFIKMNPYTAVLSQSTALD